MTTTRPRSWPKISPSPSKHAPILRCLTLTLTLTLTLALTLALTLTLTLALALTLTLTLALTLTLILALTFTLTLTLTLTLTPTLTLTLALASSTPQPLQRILLLGGRSVILYLNRYGCRSTPAPPSLHILQPPLLLLPLTLTRP